MAFPVNELKGVGGRCYAHLFENAGAGVSRNLFWSFTIEFAPVELEDADALSIEQVNIGPVAPFTVVDRVQSSIALLVRE